MKKNFLFVLVFLLTGIVFGDSSIPQGFVFIKGGIFKSGDIVTAKSRPTVRVEDFEILDHPVTNAEYYKFIEATNHPAPLHWENGQIPPGKEDYPVIFVNRYDVQKYMAWLTEKDGRVYRLPMTMEFEYAARGGLLDKKYPWGDKLLSDVNYDKNNNRQYDKWQNYLKPAKYGKPNGYKLYGMAGNVWHLTINNLDPVTTPYKYRMTNIPTLEGSRMGGSWARSAEYLRCGYPLESSSGIRHPDLGFRPIRAPKDQDWRIQARRLVAVSIGNGEVFLSWSQLKSDKNIKGYNIYRSTDRNHWGFKINDKPVTDNTVFIDKDLNVGTRYHYYLKPVDKNGKEGRRSEWFGVNVTAEDQKELVSFSPVYTQGSFAPIFGDLTGDGVADCVIRMDNGVIEESQDPGVPVQMEAFTSAGRSLWRKDICYHDHCFGSANNVPFNVWDMDGDGKAEVITRLQIDDDVYVAILDGMTGNVLKKALWPKMATDYQRSSTRIHLSIGYLDGKNPAVITQTGLYENEVFVAFDNNLNKLWQYDSFAETNGSGAHKIEVADVDGDGKQEVFDGTTCLNSDGSMRWSIYRQHPDQVSIHDCIPEREGLEVYYVVESNTHAGVYMADANTGEIIWKINREDDPRWKHAHHGWTADIWDGEKGMECVTDRYVYEDKYLVMYSATGKHLVEEFPRSYHIIEWDGDNTRELLSQNGVKIGNFDGEKVVNVDGEQPNPYTHSSLLMTADLYGDFRDELVIQRPNGKGKNVISVITATSPISCKFLSPQEELDYRLWIARNRGGGYPSIFDQPLRKP